MTMNEARKKMDPHGRLEPRTRPGTSLTFLNRQSLQHKHVKPAAGGPHASFGRKFDMLAVAYFKA